MENSIIRITRFYGCPYLAWCEIKEKGTDALPWLRIRINQGAEPANYPKEDHLEQNFVQKVQ
jgi:hypothetical protein